MEYGVIALAALVTSALTLFSGFGLGTLLMPVFALFFPVEVAVALTAIVHFLNNLFKLALLGRHADRRAVLQFGIPALLAAFLGAWVLLWLGDLKPLFLYRVSSHTFQVTPVKLVVAVLMVLFAFFELIPALEKLSFDRKVLPLGGFLSGFFGGLSGHQGALRSAFLIKCGLAKESFIATGVVLACMVDASRLLVYGSHFSGAGVGGNIPLLLTAVASAFLGAYFGNRLVKKVTLRAIQTLVGILLLGIALALGGGLI
jgi:uncharacterized membrane protein YfcA